MLGQNFSTWISNSVKKKTTVSYVQRSMMNTLQWMPRLIRWEVGDGFKIKIGSDAIMGIDGNHTLSFQLLNFIHRNNIILLHQIHQSGHKTSIISYGQRPNIQAYQRDIMRNGGLTLRNYHLVEALLLITWFV